MNAVEHRIIKRVLRNQLQSDRFDTDYLCISEWDLTRGLLRVPMKRVSCGDHRKAKRFAKKYGLEMPE